MCLSHFERCIWISWMLFRGEMGRNTKKWIAIETPDFLQSGAYHENKTLTQKSEILARWANYQASVFSWLILFLHLGPFECLSICFSPAGHEMAEAYRLFRNVIVHPRSPHNALHVLCCATDLSTCLVLPWPVLV